MSLLPQRRLAAKSALLLACCGFAPGVLGSGSSTGLVVTLAAEAAVPGPVVSLADVAKVEGMDARRVQALRRLEVGRFAAGQTQWRIERQQLERHVARHGPGGMQPLVWQGAGTAVVRSTGIRLDSRAMVDAAAARLRAAITTGGHVELKPLGMPAPLLVPAAGVSLLARAQPWAAPQRRARVDVDITVGGQLLRTVPVWFEVRTGDLPLAAPQLLSAPWVSRRQEVILEVRMASVLVESKAVALADGREGEIVQARLGSEIVRGKVVAPGRLSIVGNRA